MTRTRRRVPLQRKLCVSEDIPIATVNVLSVDDLVTVSDQQAHAFTLLRGNYSVQTGNTAVTSWLVIRRVPNGYAAPTSVNVVTGSASFIDSPDVLAYGMFRGTPSLTSDTLNWTIVKRSCILYDGDKVVVQGTPTASSVNNIFSSFIEYTLS